MYRKKFLRSHLRDISWVFLVKTNSFRNFSSGITTLHDWVSHQQFLKWFENLLGSWWPPQRVWLHSLLRSPLCPQCTSCPEPMAVQGCFLCFSSFYQGPYWVQRKYMQLNNLWVGVQFLSKLNFFFFSFRCVVSFSNCFLPFRFWNMN